ncbi:hypothetical protein DFP73DRAFT_524831 [Morchella snyderi]|nr:hypothetical protein DFP73DRAFT_524831 [Morchella snyderi]
MGQENVMNPESIEIAPMGTNVTKARVTPIIALDKIDDIDAEVSWSQSPQTPATNRNRHGKAIPQYVTTPTEDEYSDCDDYHGYLRSEAQKNPRVSAVDDAPTTVLKKNKKSKWKGKGKAPVKPWSPVYASPPGDRRVVPRHATAQVPDEYEDFDDYHEYLRATHTKPKAIPGPAESHYIPPPKINLDPVNPGRINRLALPANRIVTSLPKLPSERTYDDEFDQQTICGIRIDSEVSTHDIDDDHGTSAQPQSENLNPSLTMSQKAKLESGWQPAHKLLSRRPSYPGKIYRPQPRSGPRPQGRTFQKLKSSSQLRTFQHMRLLHERRNGGGNLGPSSWTLPYVPLTDRPSVLVSERPIHRALRQLEETKSANDDANMIHLAAEYMKAELCPSDRETEDDSLYSKSSIDANSHTECDAETESLCPVISKIRCKGQRAMKCKCKKAIAVVKRATLGSKVKLRKMFKT